MFARASVRANLPTRQTEGFNPRPRLSLPLPRPVGIASGAERLVIELTEPIEPCDLIERLAPHMPEGIRLTGAHVLESSDRCVPCLARYDVLPDPFDRTVIEAGAARAMEMESLPYRRFVHKTGKHVTVDLRPYLGSIETDEGGVRFSLHVTDGGSAKPSEVCEIIGIGGEHVNHWIRRTEVLWRSSHSAMS